MDHINVHTIRRKPVAVPSAILRQPYTKIQQQENHDATLRPHSDLVRVIRGWKPFWTRRIVLFAFMLCFAIILLALELLVVYSVRRDGLASVDLSFYYLWTYGPTAVLTLLVALWNRVDYRVRQMAPWVALSRSAPVPATDTILLDYVSPTCPEILWYSLVNKHWAVFMSSAIGVLQTILIVLSTGLFTVTPMPRTLDNAPYDTITQFVNNGSLVSALGEAQLPMSIYEAVKNLDLSYPVGTTDRFIYQEFAPADTSVIQSSIQQATVDLVVVDLDCEPAELQIRQWEYSWAFTPCWVSDFDTEATSPGHNTSISIVSNTCNVTTGLSWEYGKDGDVGNFVYGYWDLCLKESGYFNNSNNRMIFSIGQARQSGDAGPHPTEDGCDDTAPMATIDLIRSKSWICMPRLEVTQGNVTFNSTELRLGAYPEIHTLSNAQPSPLTNISLWDFDSNIVSLVGGDDFQRTTDLPIDIKSAVYSVEFGLKALERAPNATINDLMTTDLYLDLCKGLFVELAVQTLHQTITVPGLGRATGTYTKIEDRLVTRNSVVHGMQGLLGALLIFSSLMMLSLPARPVVPHDTATLGGLLQILADNHEFTSVFKGQGSVNMSELHQRHARRNFFSRISQASPYLKTAMLLFREYQGHTIVNLEPQHPDHTEPIITWWRPLTIKKRIKTLMFLLVIVLVVLLQVLLATSEANSGLADVSIDNEEHLAWSIIPAIVMVGVAIYFKALLSVYRMLAPYWKLRKAAGTKASTSVDSNYMSATELEVLGTSIPRHQAGIFFMTLSAMMAAFLTIVVSGVFTTESKIVYASVSVGRTSWFSDSGSDDNGTTGNNAIIAGMILEANLTYPAWTYQDFAFASLQLQDVPDEDHVNTPQEMYELLVTIPAIRSALNCTMYDQEKFHDLTYHPGTGGSHSLCGIYSRIPGTPECEGNETTLISSFMPNAGKPPFYYSGFVETNATNCPTLNYFWGYQASESPANANETNTTVTYAKALACFEVIEQVDVETLFHMPSFVIDGDSPPFVTTNGSRFFSSADVAIPYKQMPQQSLDTSLEPNFFGAMKSAYGITDFDFGNASRATAVADAIQKAHRIVRAQQYNATLRVDESSANAATYDANTWRPGGYRLVQNQISTHVLTALLLAMLVCALLAFWLMSTKNVLPKNPSSIAAMASLLADSNVLHDRHNTTTGSQPMHATSSGALYPSNAVFRMGWFESPRDGSKVFTINRIDRDDITGRDSDFGYESSRLAWEMHDFGQMNVDHTRQRTAKRPQGAFEEVSQVE